MGNRRGGSMSGNAATVFLDRDGVLNRAIVVDGKPYPPRSLAALEITDDAILGCAVLREAGFRLICVTNQPDVARGLMTQAELDAINVAIKERLKLDELRACPHSDEDNC